MRLASASLVGVLSLAAAPSWAAPPPPARYDLSPYLAAPIDLPGLMQALAAVPARQGSFVEEKHFAALDRPLIAHGRLDYVRPAHLEKTTTDPIAERLLVDGDRLTVTSAGGAAQTLQLSSQPMLKALVDSVLGVLAGDLPAVQAHFRVSLAGTTKAWRLTLQPADPALAQLLSVVRVDGTGATPLVFETVQANGDSQRMTVTPAPDPAG